MPSSAFVGQTNRTVVDWMDRALYPSFAHRWDDELLRREILDVLRSHHHVLDIGAGAGIVEQMHFKGLASKVCGIDLVEAVLRNPHLDEARVASAEDIPYPDGSFDVAFADNVVEHLAHPVRVFREAVRVLRPGGHFFVKTPNRWHYMPVIATLTPDWFHRWYHELRGNKEEDVFPTLYRANTAMRLRELASRVGLDVVHTTTYEGRPEYLRVTAPSYALGWAYERMVNRFDALKQARILLIGHFRKDASSAPLL
jgi:SAM-dependent methyltransferase